MRHVHVQPTFPGLPSRGALATLNLGMTPDGLTTVGWSVVDLVNLETLALGCLPAQTAQDAHSEAEGVLGELWEAGAILLDLPPFP
jgi:hypothetical protein